METPESETLVRKARAGDREAFDRLVERFRERLLTLVRARSGSNVRGSVEAEDLVQETFLRSFQAIEKFSWNGEDSFFRWLSRIAEHLIWNAAQKKARSRLSLGHPIQDTGTTPEQAVRRHERFDRLEEALRELPRDQREAVRLSRIEGLKISRIAEKMHRSEGAVKMLLSRALRQLRATLGETASLNLPARRLNLGEEPDRAL